MTVTIALVCNIVPTLPVIICDPPVKTPAESIEALAEAMKTKGGSTGNYNQATDGRNMTGDPVDF